MNLAASRKVQHPQTHDWIDQRSLALDCAVADMVRANPELLGRAKLTLARWIEQREPEVPKALLEWKVILERSSLEDILNFITQDNEEARRLRQSSPFCGILPNHVRLAILKEYETRAA